MNKLILIIVAVLDSSTILLAKEEEQKEIKEISNMNFNYISKLHYLVQNPYVKDTIPLNHPHGKKLIYFGGDTNAQYLRINKSCILNRTKFLQIKEKLSNGLNIMRFNAEKIVIRGA